MRYAVESTLRSYNGGGKRYCDMTWNLVFKIKKAQWPKIAKYLLFKIPIRPIFCAAALHLPIRRNQL